MDILSYIAQCVAFQNDYGRDNWEKNKKEIYGNEDTRELAKAVELDEWLLQAIVWDLDSIVKDKHNLIYGSGHNHVWVSNKKNNERLMMIFVKDNKLVVQYESPSHYVSVVGNPETNEPLSQEYEQ